MLEGLGRLGRTCPYTVVSAVIETVGTQLYQIEQQPPGSLGRAAAYSRGRQRTKPHNTVGQDGGVGMTRGTAPVSLYHVG